MNCARSQRGLSTLGWLVVLALGAFFVSTLIKMVPHYLDYLSLKKVITSVETDRLQDVKTVGDFEAYVARGMTVNNVRGLDLKDTLKVTLDSGNFVVQLKYEKRESLIGNLDLVAKFDNEFRVHMP
jgi:hypothetical protein